MNKTVFRDRFGGLANDLQLTFKKHAEINGSVSESNERIHMVGKRSRCPIATALDVFGDKWTLLIIRDIAFYDKHKNKDFQNSAENIPSNILAARLKQLVSQGLVLKREYQKNPLRYEYHLTEAGSRLIPILQAIATWSASTVKVYEQPNDHLDDQ